MATVLHLGMRLGEQRVSWNQASFAVLARHSYKGHNLATLHGSLDCYSVTLHASLVLSQPLLTTQLCSGQNRCLEFLDNLRSLLSLSRSSLPITSLRISIVGHNLNWFFQATHFHQTWDMTVFADFFFLY